MASKAATPKSDDLTDEEKATASAATGASAQEISDALQKALAGDKMALWNVLKRTDPKATKPFQRAGGFRGTQIDPAWRLQMMTEVFGPIGMGWGWEQLEWTIAERMVFICCRVWISDPVSEKKFYTGPQWGGTELVRRNRDGTERPDDEAFKMSMTDAIGKCFLQLGLAADIYLGQFDDSKYREESEQIYAVKANPDLQPAGIAKLEAEIRDKLAEIEDLEDLDDLWRSGINARIREIGSVDKAAQNRMTTCFAQKKNEILKKSEHEVDEASDDVPAAAKRIIPEPGDDLPKFQLTVDQKTKQPRWGALTKSLKGGLEQAIRENRDASEVHGFWNNHKHLVERMRKAGGDYVSYADKLEELYQETIAKLEAVE